MSLLDLGQQSLLVAAVFQPVRHVGAAVARQSHHNHARRSAVQTVCDVGSQAAAGTVRIRQNDDMAAAARCKHTLAGPLRRPSRSCCRCRVDRCRCRCIQRHFEVAVATLDAVITAKPLEPLPRVATRMHAASSAIIRMVAQFYNSRNTAWLRAR